MYVLRRRRRSAPFFYFGGLFMEVEYGTLQDIGSWMELVQQVRWNFPGLETQAALEDHRRTVLRFMGEQRALCVKDMKLGTETAKKLWIERLDYQLGFYDRLKAQLGNNIAIR